MQVNLILFKKNGPPDVFTLPSTVTFLGRREDCDFCIPLNSVSRKHCEINLDQGKAMVRDLKSRNGTIINGKPVQEALLKAGDILRIGPVELLVQIDGQPSDFSPYLPQSPSATESGTVSKDETQEADFNIEQDIADFDPGRSQTVDFDRGLNGFDLEDNLDLDTEISNP
ncbi:MAG: FHA domain-containing protein [Planctomycetaceae bacterium]|nr:FHA domain-containing protein [Planctomycetaceae bacterium]